MCKPLAMLVLTTIMFFSSNSLTAADLDPKAITITLPEKINWKENPSGSANAVLLGDPSKPGLYVVLTKWKAHHNSRPHFHPNDRFITVLSGTWWMNTGAKYDPEGMKSVPAESFVVHHGGGIHYDSARDEDVILQIVGIGPATAASAEANRTWGHCPLTTFLV